MLIGYNAPPLTTAPPAPSNVMVARVSDTTIRVSWQPLSLVEARGHIMYRVMVTPTTGSKRRRQATQGERMCSMLSPCEVPANDSSVIVGGLDRDTSYSVTVMAVNSEDEDGPTSVPITAAIPSRVKQFLVLDVSYSCMQVTTVELLYSRHFLDNTWGFPFETGIHTEKIISNNCRKKYCQREPIWRILIKTTLVKSLADHVVGTSQHVLYQTNGDNQFPCAYILLGKSRMIPCMANAFLRNVLPLKW